MACLYREQFSFLVLSDNPDVLKKTEIVLRVSFTIDLPFEKGAVSPAV